MSKPKILAHQASCSKQKQSKCIASNGDPHKLQWKPLQGWIVFWPKNMLVSYVSKTQPHKKITLGRIIKEQEENDFSYLALKGAARVYFLCEKFSIIFYITRGGPNIMYL